MPANPKHEAAIALSVRGAPSGVQAGGNPAHFSNGLGKMLVQRIRKPGKERHMPSFGLSTSRSTQKKNGLLGKRGGGNEYD